MPLAPSRLFKYQPYTEWSRQNLENREVRFSKPSSFNDPFDCSILPALVEPTEAEQIRLFAAARMDAPGPQLFDRDYSTNGVPNQRFQREGLTGTFRALQANIDRMMNSRGVCCFTESVDNILMWAHYAKGHRGFCLAFDGSSSFFDNAFKVQYSDSIPPLNPVEAIDPNLGDRLLQLLLTKSTDWEYEHEWRAFHKVGDQQFKLADNVLTGVYFGCAMSMVNQRAMLNMLAATSVKCYSMEKVAGTFSVTPKLVS